MPRGGRLPGTASIPRGARGTPSQAVSPLEDCPTAMANRGPMPPAPISPTLDSVSADPMERARAMKAAKEFRKLKVPGKEVAPAVRKLLKLRWHKSLRAAAYKARAEDKPILWIQALGDLRGYT